MSFIPVKIGDQLEEIPTETSKFLFENDTGFTKRTSQEVMQSQTFGPNVKLVYSEDDLPSLLNGYHQLEQSMSYKFMKPNIVIANPILTPAGYIGYIENTFLDANGVIYTGTASTFIKTLTVDQTIVEISDSSSEAGAKIQVEVTLHGLFDGQYVNITGTTSYNGDRLLISNVTADTFDIVGSFGVDEAGEINTGYQALQFRNFVSATQNIAIEFLELLSSRDDNSSLTIINSAFFGYNSFGRLLNAKNVFVNGCLFATASSSMNIVNGDGVNISNSKFIVFDPSSPSNAITLESVDTVDVGILNCNFEMSDPTQHAIFIESNVNNARFIRIQNSLDNGIIDDYFNTSSGGLDETDPQVIATANGLRKNSMASAQVGFTNITNKITVTITTQDVPVLISGTQFTSDNLERAEADATGKITIKTKQTKKYPITFSALVEKVSGGATDIGLLIIKNSVLDLAATFEIPHSVNSGVIQISATRDFELAEGDTIELAVVNFDGASDILVSQANIAYSVEI